MFKRIISFVLVIAILFCFAVPNAFAATEYRSKAVTYGEAYLTYWYNNADDVWNEDSPLPWFGTAIKGITTALNSKICEQSHDGYHASLGESISHEAFGMDDHGRYCLLSCDYCGEWFRCYSSDLIAAHDEYVVSLPATQVNSEGSVTYICRPVDSSFSAYYTVDSDYRLVITNDASSAICMIKWEYGADRVDWTVTKLKTEFIQYMPEVRFYYPEVLPGVYTGYSPGVSLSPFTFYTQDCGMFTSYWGGYWQLATQNLAKTGIGSSTINAVSGEQFSFISYVESGAGAMHIRSASGYLYYPILVSETLLDADSHFSTETRTVSLMQTINNYNIDNSVVDNSSNVNYYIAPTSYVNNLTDNSIDIDQCYSPCTYDEETLVFTEPVTGAQILTSGWMYDYTTRTYDIDIPAGTTTDSLGTDITRIELIYGDEAVTYNYYLADGTLAQSDEYAYVIVSGDENFGTGGSSGEPDEPGTPEDPDEPEEETHKHRYTSTVTTEPTCEAPGIRKYTCSECGDSYTEKINAAGHTWTVKQTVATQYDDTGSVTVQGYTIYKCTVCSTEYKDDAGTGPPNSSGDSTDGDGILKKIGELLGSILSGLLGMIEAVLGGLLDGLVRLADLIGDKLTQVVDIIIGLFDKIPQLFGGFTALLGEVFAFIPEDIMTIFTFGAAAIVFVGILMFFIKR